MRSTIAMALAGTVLLASCNQAPPPMPVKQFMAEQVQPTAEVYWNAVRFVSDESGDHEYMPETDAEWEATRKAADQLGEYGEQLKSEAYAADRGEDWKQFSQGLIDVAARAEKAAADHDVDAVFEVGGTVYSVCSACHQVYPPAELPAGEGGESAPAA